MIRAGIIDPMDFARHARRRPRLNLNEVRSVKGNPVHRRETNRGERTGPTTTQNLNTRGDSTAHQRDEETAYSSARREIARF